MLATVETDSLDVLQTESNAASDDLHSAGHGVLPLDALQ